MKTIADIKRNMIVGTKWHAFNHLYSSDMGVREISRVNSVGVYFWTLKEGEEMKESFFNWPKKEAVEFKENGFTYYYVEDNGVRGKAVLTYTKI